ncbi:hypothetical protein Q8A67_017785 [Cirrhinus molitorella]|uniref:Uncharacterized protein n=1 Tax=Cirrhinus molitorella TaxID=172907 RepID=A0AA88PIM8_9TELE|nr:hypothetical protein Q8A67_017785 [Cirrhinus molitorella]
MRTRFTPPSASSVSLGKLGVGGVGESPISSGFSASHHLHPPPPPLRVWLESLLRERVRESECLEGDGPGPISSPCLLLLLLLEARHLPQLLLGATATLIDNEPKGAAIIVAGRFGNFSGFQFLPFRIHQAPSAPLSVSGICPSTPPLTLSPVLPLSSPPLWTVQAFVRCLLESRSVGNPERLTTPQRSGASAGASSVCTIQRQIKDALWFSLSLVLPRLLPLRIHPLFFFKSKRKVSCVAKHGSFCVFVRVCYRKSLLGGQSGDPGDDRHDISSEEVLTDPELVRHEGFQDEGEGK